MTVTKSVVAEFNDDDVELKVIEVELPKYGSSWVLIQVHACALVAAEDEKTQRSLLSNSSKENNVLHIGQEIAGVVKAVGSDVFSVLPGDRVAGIVPLDYKQSGCSHYVLLQEFDIVPIRDSVSFVEASATIGEAVKVYTSLHYLGRLNTSDTVLLIGGSVSIINMFIQLTHHWNARIIIATANSSEAKQQIDNEFLRLASFIDVGWKELKSKVMFETGDLGADIIVNLMSSSKINVPSLHEVISCLSVGGRLISANPQLQLDPPQSRQLMLRCASVGFLFDQAWNLSSAQQGRYQHILMDIMEKVATGTVKPLIHKTVLKLDAACEALSELKPNSVQGRVVLSLP
ncbi:Hypothetical predicted protein [Cloeon dipterum]|uniref:Enoyl reductase (ER) domain-containing protein n=1 Tax=Cloeon dipterum TaxID=197152 RepID=A0A8S1CCV1_9INSE|nr:Hypothetical predicted protein [Cloeon dipterum]